MHYKARHLEDNIKEMAKHFKATYPHLKVMTGLVIHAGSEKYFIDTDVVALPWNFHLKD